MGVIESGFFRMDATKPDTLETSELEYAPYQEKTQLARYIKQYPRSFTRNPSQPLIERPLTLSELTGPVELDQRLGISPEDIAHLHADRPRAIGQYIEVTGRVVDEDGAPLAGSMIEIWQANSAGKYVHEMDRHEAPVDPNFIGEGRFVTDAEGRYKFRSLKPGAYPVTESDLVVASAAHSLFHFWSELDEPVYHADFLPGRAVERD